MLRTKCSRLSSCQEIWK